MPIYEYICDNCGYAFEEFTRSIADGILEYCPHCGNPSLRTQFSPPAIVYKCAGFSITDKRGLTGKKRKPNIKVGLTSELPPEERERCS